MLKDYFRMAFQNLVHRKLRTFLTLIGIFVGIAAVVGLISLTQGFQNYLDDEFKELGADKIMISPAGSTFGSSDSVPDPLTTDDVDIVAKANGVKEAGYFKYSVAQIDWGKDDLVFGIVYTYPFDENRKLIEEVATLKVLDGRPLKESDRGKVAVGYDYAYSSRFGENLVPGKKITVKGKEFEVVAVNEKIGNPSDDSSVVMTERDYEDLFGNDDEVSSIIARVQEGKDPEDVVLNIEKDLRKYRNVKEGQEDFEVTTFQELIQAFLTIFAIVSVVLIGIAAISLVVGGIGIMNTMYTSVLERTKEIGIMKAIGARNSDILTIFLIESGLLGLTGGAIGVIMGLGIAKLVELIGSAALGTELLKAAVPAWLVLGALAFAFILGSAFGLLPAKRAANMNPVDALRTE